MVADVVRTLLWGTVLLAVCFEALGGLTEENKKTQSHNRRPKCLRKRQAGHVGNHDNNRIPWRYCIPAGNGSSSGNIIQVCGRGQYREQTGPFKGLCVACNCNGLSSDCDPLTGRCTNCQFNTAGDHCQHCAEGYYGEATDRTCKLCPCPFSVATNNFALGCMVVESDVQCICKPGYAGLRCERCSPGYFGNPLWPNGKCQPCNCKNGNSNTCHPITGACENPGGPDDCQVECDMCVVNLMKDLEGLDDEFSRLKALLEQLNHNGSSLPLVQLKKLEQAIVVTKELVRRFTTSVTSLDMKVKQQEADIGTIEEDLAALGEKAAAVLLLSDLAVDNTTHTRDRSQVLLNATQDLLGRVRALLRELGSGTTGPVPGDDAARMLWEAEEMVEDMRRQNCTSQTAEARVELQLARKLLDDISRNLTDLWSPNQALADKFGEDIMRDLNRLQDLQHALKHAEDKLQHTRTLNTQSVTKLNKLESRFSKLTEERNAIIMDQQMSGQVLKNISDLLSVMHDSISEMEALLAQLEGGKTELIKRLASLSILPATARLVERAEEHARNLSHLAMAFAMELEGALQGSNMSTSAIPIFNDVAWIIMQAQNTSEEARHAAEKAQEDILKYNISSRARDLSRESMHLLSKAKESDKLLKASVDTLGSLQKRLNQAKDKMAALWKDLKANQQNLSNINRGDTGALLNSAKAAALSAQTQVDAVTTRVEEMDAWLKNVSVPTGGGGDFDRLLNETSDALFALNDTFPSLEDTLAKVENISDLAPPSGNMTESMRRIRELIQQTRQMANAIRLPMMFTGKGYVELRPPVDVQDLKAVTTLDLYLQRPTLGQKRRRRHRREKTEDTFVLYLGNKNTSGDYIGMVLRNNVLYSMYRLGGTFHSKKLSNVTRSARDPAHFDHVDFHRVYQDMEVFYTRAYSSKSPDHLPPFQLQPDSPHNLLHLDPSNTVFYIGGYPSHFTPPPEFGQDLSRYQGCIEAATLNHRLLGLYNFRDVLNVNQQLPCIREVIQVKTEERFFDRTGYAIVDIPKPEKNRTLIEFNVKSLLKDAMLFYVGNEDSYFSVTVENGFLVLSGRQGGQLYSQRAETPSFPTGRNEFKTIYIVFLQPSARLIKPVQLQTPYTKEFYKEFYVGGIPDSLREKNGITAPPLWGSLQNLPQVDMSRQTFVEMLGVTKGFSQNLLFQNIRDANFSSGSSLTEAPRPFQTPISLGFKTTQLRNVFLQTMDGADGVELTLSDGHVLYAHGSQAVRSKSRYNDGKWHYITAHKDEKGLRLTVDDTDTGKQERAGFPVAASNNNITLGAEIFTGCLGDLYIRRSKEECLPADLSQFIQKGEVNLGVCVSERPPQAIRTAAPRQRGRKRQHKKHAGSRSSVCKSPEVLPQALSLTSTSSQLSYLIPPVDLNNRPHFSLVIKTSSKDGLILHVNGKQNGVRLVLYMASGKIKLAVGRKTIHYPKRIDDNDWHKVDLSVERSSFHLLVDGQRVEDGQLATGEGAQLSLVPPVYLGADHHSSRAKGTRKSLPQNSVMGCVYNFKFYSELVGEPLSKRRVLPCFDGEMESGVYFSDDGAYLASRAPIMLNSEFNLRFDISPQDSEGLLFHGRGHHSQSISVFLQDSEVYVWASDRGQDYSLSLPILPTLCDSVHSVSVQIQPDLIGMTLNSEAVHQALPVGTYSFNILTSHYFGGLPEDNQDNSSPPVKSYIGCLKEVTLNGEDVGLVSLYTQHGPVSQQGCPVR